MGSLFAAKNSEKADTVKKFSHRQKAELTVKVLSPPATPEPRSKKAQESLAGFVAGKFQRILLRILSEAFRFQG